jgi:hypothetical protein
MKPVSANTQRMPAPLFSNLLVRYESPKKPASVRYHGRAGMFICAAKPATRALNISVMPSSQ